MREEHEILGVVRNSWILNPHEWSIDQMRHEAELEPTKNPNTISQIDRIFYHNLDKNELRHQHMESWLSEQPIPYKRISAQVREPDVCVPERNTPNRCRGMSGITKTLTGIIDAENTTTGVSLVLEDDVITLDDRECWDRMIESIKYVPNDWDIIRFDCWGSNNFDLRAVNGFVLDTRRSPTTPLKSAVLDRNGDSQPFCAGAYAMLWRAASVQKLKTMWNQTPVDDADCIIAKTDYVQSYCVNIGLFEHFYMEQELSDVSMLQD
jgi:hypothetical protein